jgi:cytoskeletal protein RodZ
MNDGNEEEGVTKIQQPGGGMFGGGGGGGSVSPRPAAGMPAPAANGYAEAAPLAARRTGGRAPAADLFGSAAQAGSEEDVMTSAPAGMPQPHAHDDKLTGQRNENSVLFSLNALTSKGGPSGGAGGGAMPAGSEASGLIDIRQLSNQIGLGEDKKKKSRIDDIMNLGGGGAFAPSLGAPVLAAPPIEEYAPKPEEAAFAGPGAAQGKNKMILFGAIGAGVLLIAGAIGLATMMMHGKDESAGKLSSSASAVASGSPAPSGSVAAAATDTSAAPSATASAAPTDSSASAAAPSATATATATATAKPTATAAATAATAAAATTAPAATATATAAATAAAAAGGSDQPFNMGEAKAKLGAIAGSVQSCKKGDSSGSGRAVITFAPSGLVQSVAVSGTGFEGTPMGACVASRFRGARVPPFSGSPFAVSKSFSIN